MKNYLKIVKINEDSLIPVYRQLANEIVKNIESGSIVKGDILPSIHDFCVALEISKNTVEKAYNMLKLEGRVISVRGKGHAVGG